VPRQRPLLGDVMLGVRVERGGGHQQHGATHTMTTGLTPTADPVSGARAAPSRTSGSAFELVRFQTVTRCPSRNKARASAGPIAPNPSPPNAMRISFERPGRRPPKLSFRFALQGQSPRAELGTSPARRLRARIGTDEWHPIRASRGSTAGWRRATSCKPAAGEPAESS
jgi:hypothetical protein